MSSVFFGTTRLVNAKYSTINPQIGLTLTMPQASNEAQKENA
jgi:hypothetical protein